MRIFLKELVKKDINKNYISWMNDYEVIKYTEQRLKKNTYKDVLNFVLEKKKSKTEFLYGIFFKNIKTKKFIHVGNIKLGPINYYHKRAEISYLIGDKKFWNKGIGTLAIAEIVKIAKKRFKLKKLNAGMYKLNKSSINVLKKNQFKLEGIFKSHIKFENKRYDSYSYGLKL